MNTNKLLKKTSLILFLVLIAVISNLILADKLASPEIYANQVLSINEKIKTVLALTTTSSLASVGVSALPSDIANPIADKLADFSQYYLFILCVLYSEKYLLSIIPVVACRYLIPIICGLFGISQIIGNSFLQRIGYNLVLVTLGISLVIPAGIGASDMIYKTYQASIESTISAAENLANETAELAEDNDQIGVQSILSRLSETSETLKRKISNIINRFIESIAVLIVTSCIIPLLVCLFFFMLIKKYTGFDALSHLLAWQANSQKHRRDMRADSISPKDGEENN